MATASLLSLMVLGCGQGRQPGAASVRPTDPRKAYEYDRRRQLADAMVADVLTPMYEKSKLLTSLEGADKSAADSIKPYRKRCGELMVAAKSLRDQTGEECDEHFYESVQYQHEGLRELEEALRTGSPITLQCAQTDFELSQMAAESASRDRGRRPDL